MNNEGQTPLDIAKKKYDDFDDVYEDDNYEYTQYEDPGDIIRNTGEVYAYLENCEKIKYKFVNTFKRAKIE